MPQFGSSAYDNPQMGGNRMLENLLRGPGASGFPSQPGGPQLPGLQNQVSSPQWWGGQQGQQQKPTSGYGTFIPPPQQAAIPQQPATETTETQTAQQPQLNAQQQATSYANQQNLIHYRNQMNQLQQTLTQLQLELSYQRPGSMEYQRKLNQINQTRAQLQQFQARIGGQNA